MWASSVYLVWDSLCFLDLYVYFLHQLREFSVIITLSRFSVPCSLSLLLLVSLWCECWYTLCCPRGPLNYLHFFVFSFSCSDWVFSASLSSKLLIQLLRYILKVIQFTHTHTHTKPWMCTHFVKTIFVVKVSLLHPSKFSFGHLYEHNRTIMHNPGEQRCLAVSGLHWWPCTFLMGRYPLAHRHRILWKSS